MTIANVQIRPDFRHQDCTVRYQYYSHLS